MRTAEQPTEDWQLTAAIHGWMPQIPGTAVLPGGNTSDVDVKSDTLLYPKSEISHP